MRNTAAAAGLGACVTLAAIGFWVVVLRVDLPDDRSDAAAPVGAAPPASAAPARPPAKPRPRARAHQDASEEAERALEALRQLPRPTAADIERALRGCADGVPTPPRDGPWRESSRFGDSHAEGFLRDGRREGLWVEVSPDGSRTETEYSEGRKHGREATYWRWGAPRFLTSYDRGAPTGTWTSWDRNGTVRSTREYVEGRVHGQMRTFHANGAVETESTYRNGLDAGPTYGWYDNGQLQFVMPYFDGKRQGEALWYHRDGTLQARGTYLDGELDGTYTTWRPDGTVETTEQWRRGVCVASSEHGADGKLVARITYEDEGTHGTYTRYGADGAAAETTEWTRNAPRPARGGDAPQIEETR